MAGALDCVDVVLQGEPLPARKVGYIRTSEHGSPRRSGLTWPSRGMTSPESAIMRDFGPLWASHPLGRSARTSTSGMPLDTGLRPHRPGNYWDTTVAQQPRLGAQRQPALAFIHVCHQGDELRSQRRLTLVPMPYQNRWAPEQGHSASISSELVARGLWYRSAGSRFRRQQRSHP